MTWPFPGCTIYISIMSQDFWRTLKAPYNLVYPVIRFILSWTHLFKPVQSDKPSRDCSKTYNLGCWLDIPLGSPAARSVLSGKKMNAVCISLQGHTSHFRIIYHLAIWLHAKCNWHCAKISIGNIKRQVLVPPENSWVIFLLYRALLIFNSILYLQNAPLHVKCPQFIWSKSNPAALNWENCSSLKCSCFCRSHFCVSADSMLVIKKAVGNSAVLWIFLYNGNSSNMIKIVCLETVSPEGTLHEDTVAARCYLRHFSLWYYSYLYKDSNRIKTNHSWLSSTKGKKSLYGFPL